MGDAGLQVRTERRQVSSTLGSTDHRSGRRWVYGVVFLAVVVGIALRAWFIFHVSITSDEAVVGLVAQQILHGHTNAFVWTQSVGGVEPFVVAAFFWVFGQGGFSLILAPLALSAVAAFLVWRVALRLVRDPKLALLVGALTWASPLVASYSSTVEGGYRGVTLVCGLATLLFALRILDGQEHYREFVALGLAVGVGWWALPEIAYFVIPGAFVVVAAVVRAPLGRLRHWGPRLGAGAIAFGIGALPWIWANVQSGWTSLSTGRFPGSLSPFNTGYVGRLGIFFKDALLLQLNLRRIGSGSLLLGAPGTSFVHRALMDVLVIVILVVVAVSIILCLLQRGRATAIGIAALLYPFLVAVEPGTWFWVDGRYTVYTGVFLSLTVAAGLEEGVQRLRVRAQRPVDEARDPLARSVFGVFAVLTLVLTVYAFHQSYNVSPSAFGAAWGNPNQPTLNSIAALERAGVRTAYASYWVAYKLDFLSRERLTITVTGLDPVRSPAIDQSVRTSADPAWLFVPPAQLGPAFYQFGPPSDIQGPGGRTEKAFTDMLRRANISYRVVRAGLLDAVVPTQRVNPPRVSPG